MDYAYSPVQNINTKQRIKEPIKTKQIFKNKRIIRPDFKSKKIVRIKQKFVNSINKHKLNKLLTNKNKIIIKYDNENETLYFTIIGNHITYQYVIDELTKQGLNLIDNDPDHIYIEDFISNDNYTFDLIIGS